MTWNESIVDGSRQQQIPEEFMVEKCMRKSSLFHNVEKSIKITRFTQRTRRRKRRKNCVNSFIWKKCVSKNVIICSKVKFLSFFFRCRRCCGCCCCCSLHFTRVYEALIVKINYAIRRMNTHTHMLIHIKTPTDNFMCACAYSHVCEWISFFLPFFSRMSEWYVYQDQGNKMARNAK